MKTLALAGCIASASTLPAAAQRTVNRGLHAPPARGTVIIDGLLDEWDLSGAIICCKDVSNLLEVESCRVAAMWDEEALYVSFRFKDNTPMRNKIDPETMPGNGWRSDCVQMRFSLDGFISHLDAWYYSDAEKPAMTISYGSMKTNAPEQPEVNRPARPVELGAEQAFRIDDDGLGYVQEIKIPWAVLTSDGKLPSPDADLRLGLELFWGDITASTWPRSRVTDNLSDEAKTVDFFWTSEENWGRLVLEPHNDLSLPPPAWMSEVRAEPQGAIPISFALQSEQYVTLAIEDAAGNHVRSLLGGVKFTAGEHTVFWSGLNDRGELLPVGEYNWVGLSRDAIDIEWRMSFYQPNRSKPWVTADGRGAWGPDHGNITAAAAGEELIFLAGLGAEAGIGLFAVDSDGVKCWSAKEAGADHLAYYNGVVYAYRSRDAYNPLGLSATGLMCFDAKTGDWLDIQAQDSDIRSKRIELAGADDVVAGLAVNQTGIFLSLADKDVIQVFDVKTLKPLRKLTLRGAGALFASDETLFAASAEGIVSFSSDGKQKILVQDDVSNVTDLAADGEHLYVSFGAPEHQVKVYDMNGTHVSTLGKTGGRTQNGFYDPDEGFFNPSGLAVDTAGRLWVVENGKRPKRTSIWENGKWIRDFIGDTGYGGGGIINPLDPTMAFYDGMRFQIDIDTGDWRLMEVGLILPDGAAEHGISPTSTDSGQAEYMNCFGGRAYLHNSRETIEIYRQREDGRWALCVFIDTERKFSWTDLNDDCAVQPDEIVHGDADADWGHAAHRWGARPSQNLDLYFSHGPSKPGLRLRLADVTPGGTPVYDFTAFELMAGEICNGIGLRDGSFNSGSHGDRGEYFSEMRLIRAAGDDRSTFWFRGENTGRWTHRLPEPGVVLFPFQAHGVADAPQAFGGELVVWVSDFGQRYLFTDDMLYVAQLFSDSRTHYTDWPDNPQPGFIANNMTPFQESFFGHFVLTEGGRYLLTSGFVDCRVFELKGIDTLKRLPGGRLVLDEAAAKRAEEIRSLRIGKASELEHLIIQRLDVDEGGNISDNWWQGREGLPIEADVQRGADVFTGYTDSHLMLVWEVRDNSPMRNSSDMWQLAFKGGDNVDVMWRAPGKKPDEAQPGKGDLRLLFTELDGECKAILYRPVSDTKAPCLFDAFDGAGRANAVMMDEVRFATEVKTTLTRGEHGYMIEAQVPWKLLGGRPEDGSKFRIDFGVLFGDESGSKTIKRAYWHNKDTQIVTDIPSEAALQPGKWAEAALSD